MQRDHISFQDIAQPPFINFSDTIAAMWIYPWSEPVRYRVIHTSLIVSGGTLNPDQPLPPLSIWYANLSEPVRLPIGLRPWYQQFECNDAIPNPEPEHFADAWIPPLALPVWQLAGLRAWNHPFLFQPSRVLPTPDVTMTMALTEVNDDVFLGGIYVYDSVSPSPANSGASVTITEIPASNSAGMSIREP